MRLKIDYIGPSLNKIYAGIHWSKRKKDADAAHLAVKIAAKGCSLSAKPVVLVFQPMIRGRAYDVSNYAYTVKLLEDGLVHSGVLADDTNKYVQGIIMLSPIKIKKPEQSYMEIELREIEGE